MAENKAEEILRDMSIPINLNDREALIKNASTSLNSKVNHQSKCKVENKLDCLCEFHRKNAIFYCDYSRSRD